MTADGSHRLAAVLRSAASELTAEWETSLRVDAASSEEVARHADEVAGAILRQAGIDPPSDTIISPSPLGRRVLARLRHRCLDVLAREAPSAEGAEVVRLLQAFEMVADQLEADWRERFSDRLSGPDGLELVVELAHDLRSPLTSILFLAETMKRARSGPVTPLQERQLGLIYSAAFGLSSVASDVIELARGGDRLVDLDPLPFSVIDILESVRDIVQPIAEEKALEVHIAPPARPTRVGHPVALSRVLLNLTTNALKFTDEGHVEVIATERDGTALEFSVRDTGRGIPAASMEMLFEPFRRRQRERDYAFSGSGLGLSICRKLVEAMHSELRVDTEADQGTRFHFTLDLPLHDPGTFLGG
ncbi:MAG: sensor histidine kinase [Gemmatimonadales bacterium]